MWRSTSETSAIQSHWRSFGTHGDSFFFICKFYALQFACISHHTVLHGYPQPLGPLELRSCSILRVPRRLGWAAPSRPWKWQSSGQMRRTGRSHLLCWQNWITARGIHIERISQLGHNGSTWQSLVGTDCIYWHPTQCSLCHSPNRSICHYQGITIRAPRIFFLVNWTLASWLAGLLLGCFLVHDWLTPLFQHCNIRHFVKCQNLANSNSNRCILLANSSHPKNEYANFVSTQRLSLIHFYLAGIIPTILHSRCTKRLIHHAAKAIVKALRLPRIDTKATTWV